LLEDYEAALESINDIRDKPPGQLRVTVAAPVADLVMAPIVARFLAQYPEFPTGSRGAGSGRSGTLFWHYKKPESDFLFRCYSDPKENARG
jgi:hypothetical protein